MDTQNLNFKVSCRLYIGTDVNKLELKGLNARIKSWDYLAFEDEGQKFLPEIEVVSSVDAASLADIRQLISSAKLGVKSTIEVDHASADDTVKWRDSFIADKVSIEPTGQDTGATVEGLVRLIFDTESENLFAEIN